MAESRVKKSLLNARVNLIFYFLALVLAFFSRKIFLNTLGADFIGLTGTLYNLLGFLNLAELGIGSAIGYVLYKPLFDQDETKISEIISVFGYLYRWIGLIILGAGCLLACFLPLIFPSTEFELSIIYFAYFSFLTSSLISYFANYKQTLLGADQKNYVVTAYFQTATIVKTLIQLASAYYTGNYYLWVAIELIFGVIYSFILNWKINRIYPWLKTEVKQGKELFRKYPEVMKYTKQIFMHKLGAFAQWQTLPLLIYTFASLKSVAYYGNYTIVTDKVSGLVNNFLGSTEAGIGNLIAEGNKEKIKKTYWELFAIRMFIAGVVSFALYWLMDSFISLWLGEEYVLCKAILILIVIGIFINQTNGTTAQFIFGYGLFQDTWVPFVQLILSIALSITGGFLWGMEGILLGNTVAGFLCLYVWKPYLLFHFGLKTSILNYIKPFVKHLMLIGLPGIIITNVLHFQLNDSFYHWFLYALLLVGLYSVTTFILLFIFTRGIKDFVFRFYKKNR